MYTVHATKKLLERVKQRAEPDVVAATSMMGNWYATHVGWRPQVVLFVNEATLLPVLMPLAPAATLLKRFPEHLSDVLGGLGVSEQFISEELAAMGTGSWAKTANRSVVGSMNEFVVLANAWRDHHPSDDLVGLSRYLAEVPCSPLHHAHGFPDREVAALVERWRTGELTPRTPTPDPASASGSAPVTDVATAPDVGAVRNHRHVGELSERDIEAALDRIGTRNADHASEARHIYDTLTWGEGSQQITQAAVQTWLWYQLPTKYLTDEPHHEGRLAGIAAELFDEIGLDRYAAICRSATTAEVHAAFDRSDKAGFSAMRRALDASGIEPPDTDSFQWGDVMGIEEASARSTVEYALEHAIDTGDLVVGGRGWRTRQREITDATLDRDHPNQPGQTWRTVIATERVGHWAHQAARRSDDLARLRARHANRLLHPIDSPPDVAECMAPVTWLLQRFGSEQPLTQAGYLNPTFVTAVHAERPWGDPFDTGPPRTETDEATLHLLRGFLESGGALRKRGRTLQRTKRGTDMAVDPVAAWTAIVEHLGANPWARFVTETGGLVLLDSDVPMLEKELTRLVVAVAAEAGWRTGNPGAAPSERDVTWAFSDSRAVLALCGLLIDDGGWNARRYRLTDAGETTVLAMLRATAAGPKNHP